MIEKLRVSSMNPQSVASAAADSAAGGILLLAEIACAISAANGAGTPIGAPVAFTACEGDAGAHPSPAGAGTLRCHRGAGPGHSGHSGAEAPDRHRRPRYRWEAAGLYARGPRARPPSHRTGRNPACAPPSVGVEPGSPPGSMA